MRVRIPSAAPMIFILLLYAIATALVAFMANKHKQRKKIKNSLEAVKWEIGRLDALIASVTYANRHILVIQYAIWPGLNASYVRNTWTVSVTSGAGSVVPAMPRTVKAIGEYVLDMDQPESEKVLKVLTKAYARIKKLKLKKQDLMKKLGIKNYDFLLP